MRSEVIKPLIIGLSLVLMAVYFNLNSNKLGASFGHWKDINVGAAAPEVRLMLGDEPVFKLRLKASELFDTTGQRQISFVRRPGAELARIMAQKDGAKLLVDGQAVALTAAPDNSMLLAMTKERMIYLLADDGLKQMMTIIWNWRQGDNGFIQCVNAALCKSLHIDSSDWGLVEGPYLATERWPDLRGMPRGRWSIGPQTRVEIKSDRPQKVLAVISLLGVLPDQQLTFNGTAVQKAKKVSTTSGPLMAGGRTLYPAAYLVLLDLQPGTNSLEITYSKFRKPVSPGASPLAAYMTGIKLKLVAE